jgi:hypothetical protein
VDTVALAATIGGSMVGLAGVLATAWSSLQQRRSASELASAQHTHERELARGARLFKRRQPIYEEMVLLLSPWVERVQATERLMTFAGDPEPPDLPSPDEWRAMQARFGTIGSPEAAAAFREVGRAINAFYDQARRLRVIREHGEDADEVMPAYEAVEEARRKVGESFEALKRLVSDELAGL